MEHVELRHIIESMILVADRPLSAQLISEVLGGIEITMIRTFVEELNQQYKEGGHAFLIQEVAGGYRFETLPRYGPYLKKMFQQDKLDKLSRPQLETLAIIAYKQPVTRTEVEMIRGVNSEGVIKNLLDRGLLKIAGRIEAPGRPFTYSTTDEFLELFGLASIRDLPSLRAIREYELEQPRNVQIAKDESAGEKEETVEERHDHQETDDEDQKRTNVAGPQEQG
ncbi:MAG: SMC-Scp complex subunit ScpB [Candidatus Omnitrophica bacterium]|nr:SMC-Scp complex subunit ScpB [Candidatus Omnitrophota bacterium]